MTAKPNFFIVGAPKCGTTSLFYYLTQHPNVYGTGVKEPHFLCEDFPGVRVVKTQAAYDKLFTWVEPQHQAIGEASITTMYSKAALNRIKNDYPGARIIYMLRNPADLLYSWHSQVLKTMNEDEQDFAKAWALQEERAQGRSLPSTCKEPFFLQYRRIGMLGERLQNLQSYFPAENIHVIFNSDMRNNTAEVYAGVLDFLGLPAYEGVDFAVLNARQVLRSKRFGRFVEAIDRSRFGRGVTRIKRRLGLGKFDIAQKMLDLNMSSVKRQPLPREVRQMILDEYKTDIQLLEQLSGRSLEHWLS